MERRPSGTDPGPSGRRVDGAGPRDAGPDEGARPGSLARRFAWASALLAGLAVMLIVAGSWWWVDRLQQDATQALRAKDTELRAARVASTLRSLQARLAELAANPLLTTALTDSEGRDVYLRPYLGSVQSINAIGVELLLVDFQGDELARNGDTSLTPAQREQMRRQVQSGQPAAWIDGPAADPELLAVTMVLYPRTRTVEGALVLKLRMNQMLADPGFRLMASPVAANGSGVPGADAPAGDEQRAAVAIPAGFAPLALEVRGQPPLPDGTLPGRGSVAIAAVLATLALVLTVVLIGTRLARRLTTELDALDQFARSVAEQAFGTARAPLAGTAEVRGLAHSLNRMLDRLNQQHARLQDAAEAQLRLLGTCIEQLNDVVMITEAAPDGSTQHRIVFVNEAFVRLTGYSRHEVLGKTPQMLQGPGSSRAELDRIRTALARWEPVRAEVLNYTKDGRPIWIEMAIVPVKDPQGQVTHWVSVERDNTARREAEAERQQLEAQLREVQKMEAIGTLAGGIAHDFNNVLAAILGNVVLARRALRPAPAGCRAGHAGTDGAERKERKERTDGTDGTDGTYGPDGPDGADSGNSTDGMLSADAPALPQLDQIQRSAERARSLVQQILTFSRRQTQPRAPQALRPLIEETVALLRATVPARVELHTRLQAETPDAPLRVMGDGTGLSQVLMNLGTNAWHALSGSTGRIEFGLESLRWPEQAPDPLPATAAALPAGRCAHLWVADDGCGIDAATQARIFEPFFTTKPAGAGTGMGLAVVLGIVQAHGGAITLDSTPGAGTCFHIYVPLLDAPPVGAAMPAVSAVAAAPAAGPSDLHGQGQHVLYVDDDDVMRTLAQALLQSWGYRVTALRQASAALDALRDAPDRFDVLVTDFNMPEISGLDLLRAVVAARPGLPVVLTSGYIPDELRDEALRSGAFALLRKEDMSDALAELLARALSRAPAAGSSAELQTPT